MKISDLLLEMPARLPDTSGPEVSREIYTNADLSNAKALASGQAEGETYTYYFFKSAGREGAPLLTALIQQSQDKWVPIMELYFKSSAHESYYEHFPQLKNPKVLQVDTVAVIDRFRRYKIGINGYILMMNAGYIICSDNQQTPAGSAVWKSLIAQWTTGYNYSAQNNTTAPYSVFVLTRDGLITRDIDTSQPKPILNYSKNRQDLTKTSVPADMIWNVDQYYGSSNILFAGKSKQLMQYFSKAQISHVAVGNFKKVQGVENLSPQQKRELAVKKIASRQDIEQLLAKLPEKSRQEIEKHAQDEFITTQEQWLALLHEYIRQGYLDNYI